jgi:hypothetical protein
MKNTFKHIVIILGHPVPAGSRFCHALAQAYARGAPEAGHQLRVVATMQIPAFVYRWYFLRHPETNVLRLSGMRPITETLIGQIEGKDGRKREQWLDKMVALGREGR